MTPSIVRLQPRLRPILLTLVAVFVAELVVMLLLPLLHLARGSLVEAIADSVLLTVVILPFLLGVDAKRARAEAQAALLAEVVEQAEDGVIRATLDGVITSWNRGAERLTGYGSEEVIGQRPTILFPADRAGEVDHLIKCLLQGERVSQFETVNVRKDGTRYDVSVNLAVIHDRNGRPVGISAIVSDISARKRAEEAQARLIRELETALARVKTLSGLLPICANCKKVRDDRGYWKEIEDYVQTHSAAEFSHGICPACATELYGEYLDAPQ